MKRKLPTPDLFSQPIYRADQDAYTNGWNDAIRHIADVFDQFPFPLNGNDILQSLRPEGTEKEQDTSL